VGIWRRRIAGERPSGRTSQNVVELAGLVTALASLIIAVVALGLAYQAWTRPFPADPTQVPSWGTGGDARLIQNPEDALAFFSFIEANAGRKVRVNAELGLDYFSPLGAPASTFSPKETAFFAPSKDCANVSLSDLAESYFDGCDFMAELLIEGVGPDRRGLFYLHGSWHLNGYFASSGFVDFHMLYRSYAITPLTPLEAVS
jgi:hypothetical protein